jgi:hypothetical protein
MSTSPCKVTDPQKLESGATEWKRLHCNAMGCESGRQGSNLRPLVPQTRTCFSMARGVQKEWFRRDLVGMTTRARVLEVVGIASTSREDSGPHHGCSPPPSHDLDTRIAVVTIRAVNCCSPHHRGPSYRVTPTNTQPRILPTSSAVNACPIARRMGSDSVGEGLGVLAPCDDRESRPPSVTAAAPRSG